MVIHARAEEARIATGIFRRSLAKILDDFVLGKRAGQSERRLQPELLGDGCKQIANRSRADRSEHFTALVWTLRKISHKAETSCSEMNAWYAAASIRPETSA